MASGIYSSFKEGLMLGTFNLEVDALKVALLSTSHSFNAAHNDWSDVSANELANGNGYTTGGATLADSAVTESGGTVKWDATDTAWTSATFSAFHAVIYDDAVSGNALICSIDFGGAQTVSNGTFTIQWNASGIMTLA